MIGETIEDPEIEVGNLDRLKPRYELVLTRHIESLLEDGRFDGRAKERSVPKSVLRISTFDIAHLNLARLRGIIHSLCRSLAFV